MFKNYNCIFLFQNCIVSNLDLNEWTLHGSSEENSIFIIIALLFKKLYGTASLIQKLIKNKEIIVIILERKVSF